MHQSQVGEQYKVELQHSEVKKKQSMMRIQQTIVRLQQSVPSRGCSEALQGQKGAMECLESEVIIL